MSPVKAGEPPSETESVYRFGVRCVGYLTVPESSRDTKLPDTAAVRTKVKSLEESAVSRTEKEGGEMSGSVHVMLPPTD